MNNYFLGCLEPFVPTFDFSSKNSNKTDLNEKKYKKEFDDKDDTDDTKRKAQRRVNQHLQLLINKCGYFD